MSERGKRLANAWAAKFADLSAGGRLERLRIVDGLRRLLVERGIHPGVGMLARPNGDGIDWLSSDLRRPLPGDEADALAIAIVQLCDDLVEQSNAEYARTQPWWLRERAAQ